jgi:Flp pilus assembly pilin Flp
MLDYLRALVATHVRSERGASVVEYGLLVAGVALACIVSLEVLGVGVRAAFDKTNATVSEP